MPKTLSPCHALLLAPSLAGYYSRFAALRQLLLTFLHTTRSAGLQQQVRDQGIPAFVVIYY